MMRKIILLLVVFSLLLAACSTESTAVPEQPAIAPTEPPALPTEPAATAAPAADAQGSSTYKIVPGESTASYEVGETFFNDNNRFNLAVGVTTLINGELQLDPGNPQDASLGPITVDISQLKSDSNRRDGRIQQSWLESSRYPMATFTPTAIDGLPSSYTEGQPIRFTVTGDLTIRETTRPVAFEVTATLQGGTLTGAATATILMSDFGVGPIEIAGMLGTEDEVKLTLNFVARS